MTYMAAFSGASGSGWTWEVDGTNVGGGNPLNYSFSSTGTHVITVTGVPAGCTGQVSASLTVNVEPTPVAFISRAVHTRGLIARNGGWRRRINLYLNRRWL